MGILNKRLQKLFLFSCAIYLSLLSGCASERNLIKRDDKFINEGLYEIGKLNAAWEAVDVKHELIGNNSTLDLDFVYRHCPEQLGIYIFRVYNHPGVLKINPLPLEDTRPFEDVASYFFKQWYGGYKYEVNLMNISKLQLANYEAAELEYTTKEHLVDLCNIGDKKDLRVLKSKWVLVRRTVSILGGQQKMMLLWYSSPIETYDKGVGEFDRFVQTFRLLRND